MYLIITYRNYPAQNAIEAFNKMIGVLITEQATKVIFFLKIHNFFIYPSRLPAVPCLHTALPSFFSCCTTT